MNMERYINYFVSMTNTWLTNMILLTSVHE